ncbi:uncharacterized protein F4807DRAFT_420146 [Annulohypoxylon truncatum]|uniref:uncharacterized protein n=1 Tax=Annulohypoxylon truncatum TaxID=327061 RepID=UPI0020081F25|nr:uncharacterized protein F4807DRAFT_420146 [Annulohypoxylon truncatum]KAI1211372.1 hypothetical protein F4807DRAFT_420146 [Annulohypoxylon truncatum]
MARHHGIGDDTSVFVHNFDILLRSFGFFFQCLTFLNAIVKKKLKHTQKKDSFEINKLEKKLLQTSFSFGLHFLVYITVVWYRHSWIRPRNKRDRVNRRYKHNDFLLYIWIIMFFFALVLDWRDHEDMGNTQAAIGVKTDSVRSGG